MIHRDVWTGVVWKTSHTGMTTLLHSLYLQMFECLYVLLPRGYFRELPSNQSIG